MMFITQAVAIAIISGVAFAALSGDKLQNISPNERLRRQASTLINRNNRNSNVRAGNACYGSIVGNINSQIRCEDSTVEIRDNRNTMASAASSTLEIRSNTNVGIDAEDAWCKFESNVNTQYRGKGGFSKFLSQFVGNRNSRFEGTNNRVVAFNNRNLSVLGNDNQLEITGALNHAVRPAGSSRNTVTVSKQGGYNSSINYVIEYVESAQIDRSKYRLGNYNFNVEASNDKIRVTTENGSVKENTSSKIVIDGQGGQTLEFNGKRVEIVGPTTFDIFV